MTQTHTVINESMRAAIGRETRRATSFPVSESDIRRWAMAVYFPEPPPAEFWDAAAAARTVHGGIVAPEEFNPFAWLTPAGPPEGPGEGANDPVRTERDLGVEPPPVAHQLNGGLVVEYGVRMRPGDVITSVTRLDGYDERDGRLGRMLFTVFEDRWLNQRDELVKSSRMTLIRY